LSGMRSFRLSIELFMYAALLREYMRIETIIKHLLFLLDLSHFLKGLSLDFPFWLQQKVDMSFAYAICRK